MNRFWKEIWLSVLLGIIIPGFMLHSAVAVFGKKRTEIAQLNVPAVGTDNVQENAHPIQKTSKLTISVRDSNDSLSVMNLDEYILGVVLGEMPVSFNKEALKAQSVVARTFALKAATTGGKHGDGSVCTQSQCCQAFQDPAEYLEEGGLETDIEKVRCCVTDTSDQVLLYNGNLIEATYFSCSGGSTEDAVAVWGNDFPYLQATDSPGEEHAAHYTDSVYLTAAQFCEKLGVSLSGSPVQWIGKTSYTSGGGVDTMEIGENVFKGTQLRQLLGLYSTAISMNADEQGIMIQTRGYGHRVGMSQYGADAMAASGSDYTQILAHYYQGTTLQKFQTVE